METQPQVILLKQTLGIQNYSIRLFVEWIVVELNLRFYRNDTNELQAYGERKKEPATIAAGRYRHRIPYGKLLLVKFANVLAKAGITINILTPNPMGASKWIFQDNDSDWMVPTRFLDMDIFELIAYKPGENIHHFDPDQSYRTLSSALDTNITITTCTPDKLAENKIHFPANGSEETDHPVKHPTENRVKWAHVLVMTPKWDYHGIQTIDGLMAPMEAVNLQTGSQIMAVATGSIVKKMDSETETQSESPQGQPPQVQDGIIIRTEPHTFNYERIVTWWRMDHMVQDFVRRANIVALVILSEEEATTFAPQLKEYREVPTYKGSTLDPFTAMALCLVRRNNTKDSPSLRVLSTLEKLSRVSAMAITNVTSGDLHINRPSIMRAFGKPPAWYEERNYVDNDILQRRGYKLITHRNTRVDRMDPRVVTKSAVASLQAREDRDGPEVMEAYTLGGGIMQNRMAPDRDQATTHRQSARLSADKTGPIRDIPQLYQVEITPGTTVSTPIPLTGFNLRVQKLKNKAIQDVGTINFNKDTNLPKMVYDPVLDIGPDQSSKPREDTSGRIEARGITYQNGLNLKFVESLVRVRTVPQLVRLLTKQGYSMAYMLTPKQAGKLQQYIRRNPKYADIELVKLFEQFWEKNGLEVLFDNAEDWFYRKQEDYPEGQSPVEKLLKIMANFQSGVTLERREQYQGGTVKQKFETPIQVVSGSPTTIKMTPEEPHDAWEVDLQIPPRPEEPIPPQPNTVQVQAGPDWNFFDRHDRVVAPTLTIQNQRVPQVEQKKRRVTKRRVQDIDVPENREAQENPTQQPDGQTELNPVRENPTHQPELTVPLEVPQYPEQQEMLPEVQDPRPRQIVDRLTTLMENPQSKYSGKFRQLVKNLHEHVAKPTGGESSNESWPKQHRIRPSDKHRAPPPKPTTPKVEGRHCLPYLPYGKYARKPNYQSGYGRYLQRLDPEETEEDFTLFTMREESETSSNTSGRVETVPTDDQPTASNDSKEVKEAEADAIQIAGTSEDAETQQQVN